MTNISLNAYKTVYHRKFIVEYYGDEGVLKSEDGMKLKCKFEVGQLESGDIILVCDFSIYDLDLQQFFPEFNNFERSSIFEIKYFMAWYSSEVFSFFNKFTNFKGEVCDKFFSDNLINVTGIISSVSRIDRESLQDYNSPQVTVVYSMRELAVNMDTTKRLHYIAFGLTNFIFGEDKSCKETLKLDVGGVKYLTIRKKKKYEDIVNFLETFKGICLTCEVLVEFDNDIDIEKSKEIVTDLCNIMSIARGTTVNWIYYSVYNEERKIVLRKHENRVTKKYETTNIIDKSLDDTKKFLEEAYTAFNEKNNLLKNNKRIIYAYLDAKARNDDLNARGIKLVVVIEILTNAFLNSPGASINRYIVDENLFNKLKNPIKNTIKGILKGNDNKTVRSLMYQKLEELNRISFNNIVSELCQKAGLNVKEDDIKLFVECRNKLVHEGTFFSKFATEEDRKRWPVLEDESLEYLFLLNFVDQTLLGLLKYKGEYISRSGDLLNKKHLIIRKESLK